MPENTIASRIIDAAYQVHSTLGPGLFESVYEEALAYELTLNQSKVEQQKPIPIRYRDKFFDRGFIADLIVDDTVVVELKSVEKVAPVHKKQLLTYLRLSDKRLGLLINFGETSLKDGISRVVNGL
ncbi:MAG TPA: GxxExxY protein [Tichowtungia sp.]|nr:GxxExxY protein [Tichowtungia sp.]